MHRITIKSISSAMLYELAFTATWVSHCEKVGCGINVLRQTACLVVGPITVGNFAFLFNCTPVGLTSDSMVVPT